MHIYNKVLSNRVAKALTMLGGDKAEETAVFVSNFNKFFDCLNVTNTFTGKHKKDDFKKPYEKANDFRVEVLCLLIHIYTLFACLLCCLRYRVYIYLYLSISCICVFIVSGY